MWTDAKTEPDLSGRFEAPYCTIELSVTGFFIGYRQDISNQFSILQFKQHNYQKIYKKVVLYVLSDPRSFNII